MQNFIIRDIQKSDREALLSALCHFEIMHNYMLSTSSPTYDYVDKFYYDNSNVLPCVNKITGELMGVASVTDCYLGFFVVPGFRGIGVASLIIEFCKPYSQ